MFAIAAAESSRVDPPVISDRLMTIAAWLGLGIYAAGIAVAGFGNSWFLARVRSLCTTL